MRRQTAEKIPSEIKPAVPWLIIIAMAAFKVQWNIWRDKSMVLAPNAGLAKNVINLNGGLALIVGSVAPHAYCFLFCWDPRHQSLPVLQWHPDMHIASLSDGTQTRQCHLVMMLHLATAIAHSHSTASPPSSVWSIAHDPLAAILGISFRCNA
jgi:hypothetical protein